MADKKQEEKKAPSKEVVKKDDDFWNAVDVIKKTDPPKP
jgi:hypothetical protein